MNQHEQSTKAVAVKYEQGTAPSISAKAEGELAQEMIALAEEAGIFIHKDEHLCEFLHKMQVGEAIPKELYLLIAELIAFAYVLDGKFPEKWNGMHEKIMEEV